MNSQTTFSVVDIETTGTDPKNDNRIIQFSCYLVKNNKIIDNYSTYINPGQLISSQISQLTGITDEQLKSAPNFEQVAEKIYQLLKDTVFVAHNINFDFNFINEEFIKIGYPELEIDGIDTVTLSQILLPTLTSYRLQDLSDYFNILHVHPHLADSDALATAHLLIILIEQVNNLPQITLDQIISVHPVLPKETFKVFLSVNRNRQQAKITKGLPEYLIVSNGLVIRKKRLLPDSKLETTKIKYPKTRKAKLNVLPSRLDSRKSQNEMMNLIYNNYSYVSEEHKIKNLLIEAPTGIGKSLGYTFPFSYLIQPNKPIVISTATTNLQEQLQNKTIPLLNEKSNFKVTSSILKGSRHYIDIAKFKNWLTIEDRTTYTDFVKAQILVWLTMTKTGDLDEININFDQSPLVKKIQHTGKVAAEFEADDFFKFNLENAKRSNFVIVNHAYLLNNRDKFVNLSEKPYLVIDETSEFANAVIKNNEESFSISEINTLINRILSSIYQPIDSSIYYLKDYNLTISSLTKIIIKQMDILKSSLSDLVNEINKWFILKKHLYRQGDYYQLLINNKDIVLFKKQHEKIFNDIIEVNVIVKKLTDNFYSQINQNMSGLTNNDLVNVDSFLNYLNELSDLNTQLINVLDSSDEIIDQHVFWLSIRLNKDINSLKINYGLTLDNNFLQSELYKFFEPVTFTGATILSSKKSKFIFKNLGIKGENTKVKRLENDLATLDNSKLYLIDDNQFNSVKTDEYYSYVANSIEKMFLAADHRKTLVLFNSLKAIEEVYNRLEVNDSINNVILAQGIHGGTAKITKQFINQENAILLGTGRFWNGIDFPGDQLEMIIIAQLPFESPKDPYNHAIYSIAKNAGHDPFYTISVPKATLKLRQGIGRLIRTKNDYGVIGILDSRLLDHNYGKTIISNLKKQVPIVQTSLDESLIDIKSFFAKHGDRS